MPWDENYATSGQARCTATRRASGFCTILRTKQVGNVASEPTLYDISYKTGRERGERADFVRYFVQNKTGTRRTGGLCTIIRTIQVGNVAEGRLCMAGPGEQSRASRATRGDARGRGRHAVEILRARSHAPHSAQCDSRHLPPGIQTSCGYRI